MIKTVLLATLIPLGIILLIIFLVYLFGNVYNGLVRRRESVRSSYRELKKGFLNQKHNRFNEDITDEEDFLEDLDDEDDSYNHYNKYITRNSNINYSHKNNHKIFDSDSNDTYSIHSNY